MYKGVIAPHYHWETFFSQGNDTAMRLAKEDKEGSVPKELYNHYTVILYDETTQKYGQVANASYYKEEVSAIVSAFDRWIAGACLEWCMVYC